LATGSSFGLASVSFTSSIVGGTDDSLRISSTMLAVFSSLLFLR